MSDRGYRYISESSMCCRRFESDDGNDIWAYFWAPYQRDDGQFICDYLIVGMQKPLASLSFGVDGLDAILGATNQVRNILTGTEQAKTRQLSWMGFTEGFGLYDDGFMLHARRNINIQHE